MSSASAMSIRFGGRREIGYVRQENQDQVSRFSSPYGEVFLLADGMGGHEGGGIAANMAITGFERHFLSQGADMPLAEALARAAGLTNADIYARGHAGPASSATMGSTLALVVVQKEHFVTAHMGDSRVYLFRDGYLKLLTRDHTAMQRMLDAGLMTAEEIRVHPDASVLTRALGQGESMELEISEPYALLDGDVLMLCSDGLSGYVEDAPIAEGLRRNEDPQRAADALAELALEAGGFDNISVWVIRAAAAPVEPVRSTAPTPVEPPSHPSVPAMAPPPARPARHAGRWVVALLALAAAAAAVWAAWQLPGVKDWIHRRAGSTFRRPAGAAAPLGGGSAAAGREVAVEPRKTPEFAPAGGRKPVRADETPAPPVAPAATAGAAANNGTRVVLVHLPGLDAMGGNTLSTLRERLHAAGFDVSDQAIADPKNEAWRLAPSDLKTAPQSRSGVVVAVYLSGFGQQAASACKVLACTSPAHLVEAANLPIFKSDFQGRQVAVFTLSAADAAALTAK